MGMMRCAGSFSIIAMREGKALTLMLLLRLEEWKREFGPHVSLM